MDLLKADGFDKAIIGIGRKKGSEDSLVYSYDKCVEILIERDEMDYDSAIEFMEFNVVDAYIGEATPIFVQSEEGFQDEPIDRIGCIFVEELEYPSIRVDDHPVFNCTTFKCRNYISEWCQETYQKITLIIGPMRDKWTFYNARVAMISGSKYNNEEYIIVYEDCEKESQ